ncbi:MAG: response regulator [Pseudomonadales bacterium]|nr:response regulator [Pseudomonadales bacterium]
MSATSEKTVLLVDDDTSIGILLYKLLALHNIKVIVAERAADAIALLKSKPEIDRLLVDINLGSPWSGREVGAAALSIRPDLSCIFMTGDHTIDLPDIDIENAHLIYKPFQTPALIELFAF